MVIEKIVKNLTGGEHYVREACHYVSDDRALEVGGFGVNYFDPDTAAHQMMAVKRDFGKEENNPVLHYIVSYDNTVTDAETACDFTKQIASFFNARHQNIYGTHNEERKGGKYHAHIVVNPCSYVDGKMLQDDWVLSDHLKKHIEKVTGQPVRQERENKNKTNTT